MPLKDVSVYMKVKLISAVWVVVILISVAGLAGVISKIKKEDPQARWQELFPKGVELYEGEWEIEELKEVPGAKVTFATVKRMKDSTHRRQSLVPPGIEVEVGEKVKIGSFIHYENSATHPNRITVVLKK